MIGIDIVSISSFQKKISKNLFLQKIFTENEISYAKKKKNSIQTLAGIFAAKEAITKAMNLNLSYILRKRIEILHSESGNLYYKVCKNIFKKGLSISHDGDLAVGICYNDFSFVKDLQIDISLGKRKNDTNKSDYGRIAFLGGSKGMAGSIYMSSMAALRSGAGLVYTICPKSISNILQIKSIENIIKEISCDNFSYSETILAEIIRAIYKINVLCIGPGMGNGDNLQVLISKIISYFEGNILIDADGLNAIAKDIDILKIKNNMVLTPHMMEFSRLTKLSIDNINKNKQEIAINFAKKYKQVLVLKGNKTLVTDGDNLYINNTGNPGMATAGSGDVLSGIISALLYRLNPFEAAKLGVFIHGLAGDIASKKMSEESLIASDIIDNIHEVFKIFRSKHV
ncbi:MAG: NAD(P)H-hydrate dehydratase [Peptoniphilaceae bacterium]|nr:NAD(P)H-hydrate dehydratase [Peptoniphilaceae bacterium]MDY6019646.1 NAD(P)H-hydrate dehydratase [Anaerococcus sp.]